MVTILPQMAPNLVKMAWKWWLLEISYMPYLTTSVPGFSWFLSIFQVWNGVCLNGGLVWGHSSRVRSGQGSKGQVKGQRSRSGSKVTDLLHMCWAGLRKSVLNKNNHQVFDWIAAGRPQFNPISLRHENRRGRRKKTRISYFSIVFQMHLIPGLSLFK